MKTLKETKPALWDNLLESFLLDDNTTRIAKKHNISRSTVLKYKEDQDFKKELAKKRTETLIENTYRLQKCMYNAVYVVNDIMTNEDNSPQVRLNAAQTILSQAKGWTETVDIINHVNELEEENIQFKAVLDSLKGVIDERNSK